MAPGVEDGFVLKAQAALLARFFGLLDRFTRKPKLNGFAVYCAAMGLVMLVLGATGVLGHH